MSEYMDYIEKLKSDINYQINQKHEYILQNVKLKNELLRVEEMEDYWDMKSSKLEEENKQLKKEIDDFYYEQSKLKESDFYIKALKNQIFKCYLKEQQQERLISELKLALSSYYNFVDETFPD